MQDDDNEPFTERDGHGVEESKVNVSSNSQILTPFVQKEQVVPNLRTSVVESTNTAKTSGRGNSKLRALLDNIGSAQKEENKKAIENAVMSKPPTRLSYNSQQQKLRELRQQEIESYTPGVNDQIPLQNQGMNEDIKHL